MTLRWRLALLYGAGLAIGLVIFAIVSIVTIDRTLRKGLDERLITAARAAAALADTRHGLVTIDKEDRRQMHTVFSTDVRGAIVGMSGDLVGGDPLPPIAGSVAAPQSVALFSRGRGEGVTRFAIVPIFAHDGKRVIGGGVAWRPDDYIDEFDRSAILVMAGIAAAIVIIALAISGFLARRVLAPLERMSAVATQIEAHDLSQRLATTGSDELAQLSAAFDRMLDRLEAAFARQRRFTADASHELRAPLSVIRAEADLALRKDRESVEYRRTLKAIADESDRIETLVAGLLETARAEAGVTQRTTVDLNGLVQRVADRIRPSADAKEVHIIVDLHANVSNAFVDERGVDRALTAIVHNAVTFTPQDGTVTLQSRNDGAQIVITVSDTGPGFSEEALSHATERFWRETAGQRNGSGLGLAIARALVEADGGTILLSNSPYGAVVATVIPSVARSA